SGRAFLVDAVGAAWTSACAGNAISLAQRALLRTAATHATRESTTAVDIAYEDAGGTAVYANSPIQRYFRDVHVVTQHMMVAPAARARPEATSAGSPSCASSSASTLCATTPGS